ncbi:aldehyde dehydrogenase family protein [soil metagenome]
MPARLDILKTYKLFVNGQFPRSESGRSEAILGAAGAVIGHSSKASRKDLRDAIIAARAGMTKWKGATAYNRGQVLYRMAEMLEARRGEFAELLALDPRRAGAATSEAVSMTPDDEVTLSVDRLVAFAGWADKFTQVLGNQNAVAGPYWNITVPEATGVIVIAPPTRPALLGLVTGLAPVIVAGNGAVVLSDAFAPVVSVFGEVCATSDLPAGVVNLLTGALDELLPVAAKHRDVDGMLLLDQPAALNQTAMEGAADNLKRVRVRAVADYTDRAELEGPWTIEAFVEFKTAWHPVGA